MHHRFNILTLSLKKINYKRQIKSIFFKIGLSLFFNIFINQFNMSHIYDWFERGNIKSKSKDEKGVDLITYYYKCKVCLEKLNEEQLKTYQGVTANRKTNSNLHKHLSIDCTLHKKAKEEYNLANDNKNKSTPNLKRKLNDEINESTPKKNLLNMNAIIQTPKYQRNSSFQIGRFRQLLLFLVKCMLPISLVERQPFRDFVALLDPSFHMPTRYLVKQTGLPNLRIEIRNKLKNILKSIPWPNISLDGWSDGILRSFNGYIVQGINDNWILVKHTLSFKNSKGSKINVYFK